MSCDNTKFTFCLLEVYFNISAVVVNYLDNKVDQEQSVMCVSLMHSVHALRIKGTATNTAYTVNK